MSSEFNEKKRVLVISNEPLVLAELKMALMDFFETSITATSDAALAALESYEVAVIIICIGESRDYAFSLFAGISGAAKSKSVPVMFLAGKDNGDDEAEAFNLGAVDYAVRRSAGAGALTSRINLRINSAENERFISYGEYDQRSSDITPETILADKTILIVDDVELNRELIAGMLSGIDGLTLDFAGDGEEAVKKYAENPNKYLLILMDVQMPVMSGTDATKTIRNLAYETAREIPIIALTAGVEEEEIASYLEAGMNNFLKKPMDFNQLLNMVAEYCI